MLHPPPQSYPLPLLVPRLLEPRVNGIRQYTDFCVWLLSLTVSVRSTSMCEATSCYFYCCVEFNCVAVPSFICLS